MYISQAHYGKCPQHWTWVEERYPGAALMRNSIYHPLVDQNQPVRLTIHVIWCLQKSIDLATPDPADIPKQSSNGVYILAEIFIHHPGANFMPERFRAVVPLSNMNTEKHLLPASLRGIIDIELRLV
ncbi:hypothetical protein ACTXT7_010119 [Hymenolepis weldensis]